MECLWVLNSTRGKVLTDKGTFSTKEKGGLEAVWQLFGQSRRREAIESLRVGWVRQGRCLKRLSRTRAATWVGFWPTRMTRPEKSCGSG